MNGKDEPEMTLNEAKSRLMTCITDCGDCFCCADHDTAVSVVLEELDNRESGWISVEDRLPPLFSSVLMAIDKQKVLSGFLGHGEMWFTERFYRINGKITHWQSLPEPPKEVAHETD